MHVCECIRVELTVGVSEYENETALRQCHVVNWQGIEYTGWYKVKQSDVSRAGGHHLLQHHYDGCLAKALITLYPQHKWAVWKFSKVPNNFWDDMDNQREFFDAVGKSFGVVNEHDWYKITQQHIVDQGGAGLLSGHYNGSLAKALMTMYLTNESTRV